MPITKGAQKAHRVSEKKRVFNVRRKGEMKDVTKESYDMAVEKVTAKYSKLKDVTEKDIEMLRGDLNKYWKNIQTDAKQVAGAKKTPATKKAK
jgi:ribosomal protein S20